MYVNTIDDMIDSDVVMIIIDVPVIDSNSVTSGMISTVNTPTHVKNSHLTDTHLNWHAHTHTHTQGWC